MVRHLQFRRIYDDPCSEYLHLDEWMREIAPSTSLRRWYGHRPERFAEFGRRYRAELADPQHAASLDRLRRLTREGPVTLLTATKDIDRSQAAVLIEVMHDR